MEELNTAVEAENTNTDAATHEEEPEIAAAEGTPEPETEQPETETSEQSAPEPFLTVKYNHEQKGLSAEEAATWAQKGMFYEARQERFENYEKLHNKLDYLAALQDTTPDALIEGLTSAQEANYRAELKERFGDGDEAIIEDMMALYRNRQKDKYEKVLADRKAQSDAAAEQKEVSLNTRLAEEFAAMKAEFPELSDFASLPAEVKKAAGEGMPLEYAYLKYGHTESKKAAQAKETAERAAKASTGSMAGESDTKTDDERRFLNALWGR